MRKSSVTVTVIMPLEKEPALIQAIVPFLSNLKTQGEIDSAHVTSKEVEEPYDLEI